MHGSGRRLVLLALAIPLAACGQGGPEAPPTTTSAEAVDAAPHLFVQVAASTDKTEYEVGEPVLVTRVFEDRGPAPAGTPLYQFGRDNYLVIGIKTGRSSGLYDAGWVEPPTPTAEVGARVEGVLRVELPGPGEYTLEVPPMYVARSGFGTAVDLPITIVDHGDPRHLDAKAERLGQIIAEEELDFVSCWTEAQGDLRALGPAATPHLRRWLLEADSLYLRAVSAKLLGQLRAREGIPELTKGLADENEKVRRQCVEALGGFREPETLDALLAMTSDPDAWVRIETYQALTAFADERVKPALQAGLEDEHEYARISAAEDLAKLGDAAGIGVLIEALRRDPSGLTIFVTASLESLTGRSFGKAEMPGSCYDEEEEEARVRTCEEIAARWIRWWEEEGRDRFGR